MHTSAHMDAPAQTQIQTHSHTDTHTRRVSMHMRACMHTCVVAYMRACGHARTTSPAHAHAKIDARIQRSCHQLRVVRRRNIAHTYMYAAGTRTCMHARMHRLRAHVRKTSRRNTPQGVRALAHTQTSTPRTQTEQHTGTPTPTPTHTAVTQIRIRICTRIPRRKPLQHLSIAALRRYSIGESRHYSSAPSPTLNLPQKT